VSRRRPEAIYLVRVAADAGRARSWSSALNISTLLQPKNGRNARPGRVAIEPAASASREASGQLAATYRPAR
jgi:hypothetical protein